MTHISEHLARYLARIYRDNPKARRHLLEIKRILREEVKNGN